MSKRQKLLLIKEYTLLNVELRLFVMQGHYSSITL